MASDIVYISAPYEKGGSGAAIVSWETLRPFQPLLGQDAQMAAFSALAHRDGLQVCVLTAPEIYGNRLALDHLGSRATNRVLAHVRFGPPHLPRLLKTAANVIVLIEDTAIPLALGRHPFAAGAVLPAGVDLVLIDDRLTPVPERIGGRRAPVAKLPLAFACAEKPVGDTEFATTAPRGLTLQFCGEYHPGAWQRDGAVSAGAGVLDAQTAVLLPWNLAAPGSLVPETLRRVKLLAEQDRFPLTVVVLPYNDVPGSLAHLEEVAGACAERLGREAIVLARARSIGESFALLDRCRRAWIDTTDPEWIWTLRRVTACGLAVNFLSNSAQDAPAVYDLGSFAPDELVTRETHGRTGRLFWRTRMLSLHRLAGLANAVGRDMDRPFRPKPAPKDATEEPRLRDLLQKVSLEHG